MEMKIFTTSVFFKMSSPIVLLKKLANNGFIGFSVFKKPYNIFNAASLLANASLICAMSNVNSSHALLEYLQKKKILFHYRMINGYTI